MDEDPEAKSVIHIERFSEKIPQQQFMISQSRRLLASDENPECHDRFMIV
jgi:hypothetical protein